MDSRNFIEENKKRKEAVVNAMVAMTMDTDSQVVQPVSSPTFHLTTINTSFFCA